MEKLIGKLLMEGNITADVAIQLLGGVLKEVHDRELTEARKKMKEALEEAFRIKKDTKEIGEKSKEQIEQDFKKLIEDKIRENEAKKKQFPNNPFDGGPFQPKPFPPFQPNKSPWDQPYWDADKYRITMDSPKTFADLCSCNPKNGGSGICNCTMANQPIWNEGEKITPPVMPLWYSTLCDERGYMDFSKIGKKDDADETATLGDNV